MSEFAWPVHRFVGQARFDGEDWEAELGRRFGVWRSGSSVVGRSGHALTTGRLAARRHTGDGVARRKRLGRKPLDRSLTANRLDCILHFLGHVVDGVGRFFQCRLNFSDVLFRRRDFVLKGVQGLSQLALLIVEEYRHAGCQKARVT